MKKINFLFIALVLIVTLNSVGSCVIAVENTNENNSDQQTEKTLSEEEITQQKQEILASIESYLEDMSKKLESIDIKIDNTKKQDEFAYYPAIRLNIDTPMFGMTAIVENKLRIKKDVATIDVANKYSIRDVIKDKSLKLPKNYIASIVMETRDVKIDENMSLEELKLTLVKCIQYYSQVKSVEEFIDSQINKTFKDYIAQEKKDNINDIKDRTNKVEKNLRDISDKIYEMTFIGIDTTEYKELYSTAKEELYNISQKSKDTLMKSSELTELMKTSVNNEATVLDIKTKVDEAYESAIVDMDYLATLQALSNIYKSKVERMEKYIENANTEEKKIVNEVEQVVTIQNYNVTSQNTVDYIKSLKEDVENKIETYKNSLKSEQGNNEEESEEDKEKEDKTREELYNENKSRIDDVYSKYKEMLNREYKFYINNINILLNDSNTKMTSIIGQIDSGISISNDIFSYTRYIYIDLPENLSNYLDKNNMDCTLELNDLINSLNTELNTLTKTNMNIKKMYEKMIEDTQKS